MATTIHYADGFRIIATALDCHACDATHVVTASGPADTTFPEVWAESDLRRVKQAEVDAMLEALDAGWGLDVDGGMICPSCVNGSTGTKRCRACGRDLPAGGPTDVRGEFLVGFIHSAVLGATADLTRKAWDEVTDIASVAAERIGSHGDELQYGGKHCAEAFDALAAGLAAASFAPGGVDFLGAHWCARHPEVESRDGQYAEKGGA
jgi:hypothetical protein